ncbi:MAG: hypothetical protein JXR97_16215 [Planctomycetes bacterium]|nr:hypothetical protein [Planctomycetota bacterium]
MRYSNAHSETILEGRKLKKAAFIFILCCAGCSLVFTDEKDKSTTESASNAVSVQLEYTESKDDNQKVRLLRLIIGNKGKRPILLSSLLTKSALTGKDGKQLVRVQTDRLAGEHIKKSIYIHRGENPVCNFIGKQRRFEMEIADNGKTSPIGDISIMLAPKASMSVIFDKEATGRATEAEVSKIMASLSFFEIEVETGKLIRGSNQTEWIEPAISTQSKQ